MMNKTLYQFRITKRTKAERLEMMAQGFERHREGDHFEFIAWRKPADPEQIAMFNQKSGVADRLKDIKEFMERNKGEQT